MLQTPIFATRIDIAEGPDTALVIITGPSGPVTNGVVQVEEVCRLVVTHTALAAMAKTFAQKAADIAARAQPIAQAAAENANPPRVKQESPLLCDTDDDAERVFTPTLVSKSH